MQEPMYQQYMTATHTVHADRDEASCESGVVKWNAVRRAAEELLIVSHTAQTLLPFTPDRIRFQPSRFGIRTEKKRKTELEMSYLVEAVAGR
ncbi:hypothetical protein IAT40_003998 [Kwoniella sp. CBS 6097]